MIPQTAPTSVALDRVFARLVEAEWQLWNGNRELCTAILDDVELRQTPEERTLPAVRGKMLLLRALAQMIRSDPKNAADSLGEALAAFEDGGDECHRNEAHALILLWKFVRTQSGAASALDCVERAISYFESSANPSVAQATLQESIARMRRAELISEVGRRSPLEWKRVSEELRLRLGSDHRLTKDAEFSALLHAAGELADGLKRLANRKPRVSLSDRIEDALFHNILHYGPDGELSSPTPSTREDALLHEITNKIPSLSSLRRAAETLAPHVDRILGARDSQEHAARLLRTRNSYGAVVQLYLTILVMLKQPKQARSVADAFVELEAHHSHDLVASARYLRAEALYELGSTLDALSEAWALRRELAGVAHPLARHTWERASWLIGRLLLFYDQPESALEVMASIGHSDLHIESPYKGLSNCYQESGEFADDVREATGIWIRLGEYRSMIGEEPSPVARAILKFAAQVALGRETQALKSVEGLTRVVDHFSMQAREEGIELALHQGLLLRRVRRLDEAIPIVEFALNATRALYGQSSFRAAYIAYRLGSTKMARAMQANKDPTIEYSREATFRRDHDRIQATLLWREALRILDECQPSNALSAYVLENLAAVERNEQAKRNLFQRARATAFQSNDHMLPNAAQLTMRHVAALPTGHDELALRIRQIREMSHASPHLRITLGRFLWYRMMGRTGDSPSERLCELRAINELVSADCYDSEFSSVVRNELAERLLEAGKTATGQDRQQLLAEALCAAEVLTEIRPAKIRRQVTSARVLAEICAALGDHDRRTEVLRSVLQLTLERVGPEHHLTQHVRMYLADALWDRGDRQGAYFEIYRANIYGSIADALAHDDRFLLVNPFKMIERSLHRRLIWSEDQIKEETRCRFDVAFDKGGIVGLRTSSTSTGPLWLARHGLLTMRAFARHLGVQRAAFIFYSRWLGDLDETTINNIENQLIPLLESGGEIPEELLIRFIERHSTRRVIEPWFVFLACLRLGTLRLRAKRLAEGVEAFRDLIARTDAYRACAGLEVGQMSDLELAARRTTEIEVEVLTEVAYTGAACCLAAMGDSTRSLEVWRAGAPWRNEDGLWASQHNHDRCLLLVELLRALAWRTDEASAEVASSALSRMDALECAGLLEGRALEELAHISNFKDRAFTDSRMRLLLRYLETRYLDYWDWSGLSASHAQHDTMWKELCEHASRSALPPEVLWQGFSVRKGVLVDRFLRLRCLARCGGSARAEAWLDAANRWVDEQLDLTRQLQPTKDAALLMDELTDLLRIRERQWTDECEAARQIVQQIEGWGNRLAIAPRTLLLDYYRIGDQYVVFSIVRRDGEESSIQVNVVTRDEELATALGRWTRLVDSARGVLDRLDDLVRMLHDSSDEAHAVCQCLAKRLLPQNVLAGIDRIVVIPDDELRRIPWHVLEPERGQPLYRSAEVSCLSSIRDLDRVSVDATKRDFDGVFRGVTTFDGKETRIEGTSRRFKVKAGGFDDLPSVAAEEVSVHELWNRAGWKCDSRVDDRLSAEGLRDILQHCRVAHIATHGHLECHDAQVEGAVGISRLGHSHLVLGRSENGRPRLVSALEIGTWSVSNVDLLVLSACSTGQGPDESGEELQSIRRGFAQAGVRSMIVALTSVRSDFALAFVDAFYRHGCLPGGEIRAGAFRDAISAMGNAVVSQPDWQRNIVRTASDLQANGGDVALAIREHPVVAGTFQLVGVDRSFRAWPCPPALI